MPEGLQAAGTGVDVGAGVRLGTGVEVGSGVALGGLDVNVGPIGLLVAVDVFGTAVAEGFGGIVVGAPCAKVLVTVGVRVAVVGDPPDTVPEGLGLGEEVEAAISKVSTRLVPVSISAAREAGKDSVLVPPWISPIRGVLVAVKVALARKGVRVALPEGSLAAIFGPGRHPGDSMMAIRIMSINRLKRFNISNFEAVPGFPGSSPSISSNYSFPVGIISGTKETVNAKGRSAGGALQLC